MKEMNVKYKLSVLLLMTFMFNIVCIVNRTYSVSINNHPNLLSKINEKQYLAFINDTDISARVKIINGTTINYFGFIPLWADYIVYSIYFFILLSLLLINFKKSKS